MKEKDKNFLLFQVLDMWKVVRHRSHVYPLTWCSFDFCSKLPLKIETSLINAIDWEMVVSSNLGLECCWTSMKSNLSSWSKGFNLWAWIVFEANSLPLNSIREILHLGLVTHTPSLLSFLIGLSTNLLDFDATLDVWLVLL